MLALIAKKQVKQEGDVIEILINNRFEALQDQLEPTQAAPSQAPKTIRRQPQIKNAPEIIRKSSRHTTQTVKFDETNL